jgi:DNA adenine methylase
VVLSGYPSALYDRLYADWHRLDLAGFASQASAGRRRRTEVLWCNRDPGWLLDCSQP